MADAIDSKSIDRKVMRVQVPLPAPNILYGKTRKTENYCRGWTNRFREKRSRCGNRQKV